MRHPKLNIYVNDRKMFFSVFFLFWIFLFRDASGNFDANFTLQNIWGRLPQPGLRSTIQCVSSDGNTNGIKFSRKVNTGQGIKLPKLSQQFVQGKPVFARIFLMPSADKLNRFGAFQCKINRGGVPTEIVTLKLPPEGFVELDAASPYITANKGDDVELEVVVQKKKEHIFKWRHNGGNEIAEWDDKLRIELNNVQVSDAGVYECYYEGRRNESLHAILRLIVRACPTDFYGDDCESECPPCYNGGICHDTWGVCVCPAGFTGENCEKACGGNHFGTDCSKQCTPPQESVSADEGCAFHLFCKPDPYGCSCAPGFKGGKCMDHCEPGWYGADCKQRCHCFYGQRSCNRITGACSGGCQAGWRGDSCQIEDPDATPESLIETTTEAFCPVGHFGASCEKKCHCTGNEGCHVISGQCATGCAEGWGGPSCSVCSLGRFGDNCESTCHCEGDEKNCDTDGFCAQGCKAGWAGFTCQQECTPGRFGSNCASTCHCKDGHDACNRVTGICAGDCLPGFMGDDCQTMCPHNTYGVNCAQNCSCSNGGQCSRMDGTCRCQERWRGTICNESEPQIIAATDEEVNVGQQVFISCTVDAIPAPSVTITSEKFPGLVTRVLSLEKNQYQTVLSVKSDDSGEVDFTCSAINPHGFDMKIITLSVIDPPRLAEEPDLLSTTNTSLEVQWKEWMYGEDEGGKSDDAVDYMVVYRKSNSKEWLKSEVWKHSRTSLIEDLEPDTEYHVAVMCRRPGKGGEGEPSPHMDVKTNCGDPLPDAIPQEFVPETITSTSVKLTWRPPSESQLKCTLNGYRLEYHVQYNNSDRQSVEVPDTMNEIELNNLVPHSDYVLHLFPVPFEGNSKYFAELIINTKETTPGPVRNLKFESTGDPRELTIMWEEPLTTGGILKGYDLNYHITDRGMCGNIPGYDAGTKSVFSTDTQLMLMDLHPYSTYLVSVQAKTAAGEGNVSSIVAQTDTAAPDVGPLNLRMTAKTSTSLKYKWDPIPCEQSNGEVIDYEYKLVTPDANRINSHTIRKRFSEEDSDDKLVKLKGLEVIVSNLEPYKEYGFTIRANTIAGAGPFTEFLYEVTDEAEPPSPNLLKVLSSSSSSLKLSWAAPDPPQGEIVKYRIKYHIKENPVTDADLILNGTGIQSKRGGNITKEVFKLKPATEYVIKVQAATNAGWGKWSDHVTGQTLDGVPDAPSNVVLVNQNSSSLEIAWKEPSTTNGVIAGYKVTYVPVHSYDRSYNVSDVSPASVSLGASSRGIILNYLHSATQYAVKVTARTSAGYGPPSEVKGLTGSYREHVLPEVKTVPEKATNESIPISFSTIGKSSVHKYQIIVQDSNYKGEIDDNSLSDYNTAVAQKKLPYYITAEIDPNNVSDSDREQFVVGDRRVWGGYQNVHLNQGHQYRVRIRTVIKRGEELKYVWSDAKEYVSVSPVQNFVSDDKYEIFGMHLLLFILILAVALILVTAVIFFTTVYFCRRRERKKKVSESERSFGLSESLTWSVMYKVPENEAADGPIVNDGCDVMPGYENAMSLKKVKKESKISVGIKVENLPEYVHNAVASSRLPDEFKRLAAGQTAAWTVARKSENLKKNRYGNILPYDRHRVVLHSDQSSPGSDYINASYVDGFRRPKEYIVTQGPLEATVVDFWRMVWNESVPVVVMVTELIENGKKKCFQYWPDDSMVCGKLQILLIHSEQHTNFVIRTILMRSVEEAKTHRVHQYQFTEWPDRTIPTNPCFLIKMMKRIRNDHPVLGGPMVIHCSAGAGRSGVYLALDALTQQAEEEKRVDIFRFVNSARSQRINLVQTPEQYVFIHEALLEAIQYEDTSIPMKKIALYLKEEHCPIIKRQYDMLNKTQKRVDIDQCRDAFSDTNIFKNRDPTTVPADSVRIRLESKTEENYINAVAVNGYRRKNAYLVTQMPLQHTIENFWQLVYQHKSSLLLMLNGCDVEDDLNIGQYWPTKGQATYENFEVQVVTFEDQGEVIIRIMRLVNHDQPNNEPHKVIQLQYKAWEDDAPPHASSMLKLVKLVDLWYSRTAGGPITVHCLDGATRSGLFCAVHFVCSQMKAEGAVDVYQIAKDIRINRPELLSSFEQYKYCFEVAQELVDSIAESNNANTITRKKLSCYV